MRALLLVLLFAATARGQAAVSTTQLILPGWGGYESKVASGSGNQFRCARVVSPFSITGATKLSFAVLSAFGGTSCSVGLYDDSGNFLIGSSISCATTGVKVTTTSPSVNLTAGTPYRLCWCAESASVQFLALEDFASSGQLMVNIMNAGSTNAWGTAANSCTAGALPPTTGAITAATVSPPMVVIE